jgi:hypothetical protein
MKFSSLPDPIPTQSVYNPGFMVMYSNLSQCDWEATVKQDCFELLNQPIKPEAKKQTNTITIVSVLVTFILFSATTLYQFPRLFRSYQEVGQNISTEIFTLMHY